MDVPAAARDARQAARRLLQASDAERRAALHAIADALTAAQDRIQAANQKDLDEGVDLSPALRQRLSFPVAKLAPAVDGERQVADLDDPVGQVLRATDLADGLRLFQETVPLGVVACIFESRPDVCIQIPALSLRTANAVLLKGGKEARHTNEAIVTVIREAVNEAGLPADAVQLLPDREAVQHLLDLDGLVDLIIPRGSNELVRSIQAKTHIPVLGHAAGICHIYIDAAADPDTATHIALDAKLDYPSACNAVETLLVHESMRPWFEGFQKRLEDGGGRIDPAPDYDTEYGEPTLAVRFVPDLDTALEHIAEHGSGHTECIVTEDHEAKQRFLQNVDAAGVYVNASTRFADGYRYGLGAEVGISTSKIHARGPVGLEGLVSTRWVLVGSGHAAGDFKAGGFLHQPAAGSIEEAIQ